MTRSHTIHPQEPHFLHRVGFSHGNWGTKDPQRARAANDPRNTISRKFSFEEKLFMFKSKKTIPQIREALA